MALTKNYFGAELLAKLTAAGYDASTAATQVAPFTTGSLAVAHLGLGFLVMTLVASLGGPTGPGSSTSHILVHVSSMRCFQNQFLVNIKAILNGIFMGTSCSSILAGVYCSCPIQNSYTYKITR